MPSVSASHRRLIRRRVLAELSAPSPPKGMGKRKAKKPSPSKSPKASGTSPPPENSPPPPFVSTEIDDVALPSPISEEVSDAHLGYPAEMDAQPSLEIADLSPAIVKSSSDETPIVIPPTVPSSDESDLAIKVVESSTAAMPVSSSASLTVSPEVAPTADTTGPSVPLADAVAKESSLSSQIAVNQVPSPISDGAKTTGILPDAEAKDVPLSSLVTDSLVPPQISASGKETNCTIVATKDSSATGDHPNDQAKAQAAAPDSWCNRAKGVKQLSKKGEAFTLPSGEACIKIPNSVIEKNRKSWEPFVLGQFYSDPPSQGTLHNIVNGIWSKQYRDIAVSKMEGFSFLFRIPNAATRNRVIKQKLWQIEGQTMFVDKWEPGVTPTKPELTSAPIWLELRNVPFQFFNEDGLERIAGLVGDPRFLHPATVNKTNLEVAKVFTIIDPRKPLPEAVNVQFDSGVISRVLVSSPWMPPVCEVCKEIGHSTRRCPSTPKPCSICSSTDHVAAKCPKAPKVEPRGRKTRRSSSRRKQQWVEVENSAPASQQTAIQKSGPTPAAVTSFVEITNDSKLGTVKDRVRGESSVSGVGRQLPRSVSGTSRSSQSEMLPDSSDVESSDSELEEGEFSKHEPDFEVVRNRKRFSGQKGKRGKGPKIN